VSRFVHGALKAEVTNMPQSCYRIRECLR